MISLLSKVRDWPLTIRANIGLSALFAALTLVALVQYRFLITDKIEESRLELIKLAIRDPLISGNSLELRQRVSELTNSNLFSCLGISLKGEQLISCNPEKEELKNLNFKNVYNALKERGIEDVDLQIFLPYFPHHFFYVRIWSALVVIFLFYILLNLYLLNKVSKETQSSNSYELSRLKRIFHDLRSPLSTLNIVFESLSPSNDKPIALALKAHRAILNLASEALVLNRQGWTSDKKSNQTIEFTRLDKARRSLSETIDSIRLSHAHLAMDLKFFGDTNQNYSIHIREDDFCRVLQNIIDNSIESSTNPKIQVICAFSATDLAIIISDDGVGISDQNLLSIGKKEFTTKSKGNGIGLSSAIDLVNSASGKIDYYSSLNRGTLVCIDFPVFPVTA